MQNFYEFVKNNLLHGMTAVINQVHDQSVKLTEFEEDVAEDRIVCRYQCDEMQEYCCVTVRGNRDSLIFRIDTKMHWFLGGAFSLAAENAFNLKLGAMKDSKVSKEAVKEVVKEASPDAILTSVHSNAWWMYPQFLSGFDQIGERCQSVLVKFGEKHYHMLPLCGDNFRCECNGTGLHLTSDTSGLFELHGDFLAITAADDPTQAFEKNIAFAKKMGAIRVPLRQERQLPELFQGFGWCSWNAFYKEVTAEKLFAKLEEFREKKIPVKWIIIDDGWSKVKDSKLAGFEADTDKFPEGLKNCIQKIKADYGVEAVGVWHAFNGYWDGICEDSLLYQQQKENLQKMPCGLTVPALDEENAFRFWDAWHSYLADCGVDFVKVDNQSSWSGVTLGAMPTAEACRIAHKAIECSIFKNFGGAVINCMGMDMESVQARPASALTRNSDDFFPEVKRGFVTHLTQNVYSALWHNPLYYCDFDMWWSKHESAVQSGVLRAISGSPIYVSDAIGDSSYENILPTIEDDGTVMLCDYACRPTTDCIYVNCPKEKQFLKVWNRSGDNFALAVFNGCEEALTGKVEFGQIPELDGGREYVAYEYFTGSYTRVTADAGICLTLEGDDVRVWSIYPIMVKDGREYILQGDVRKYVPIASEHKKEVFLSEILPG